MEELQFLPAERQFGASATQFDRNVHEFDLTEIRVEHDDPVTTSTHRMRREKFDLRLAEQPSELKLVTIRIGDPFPISLEKKLFYHIFRSFDMNPYILHLIIHNSYGLHEFLAPKSGGSSCFFFSTIMHMLAWSFNSETMETRAILMIRDKNGFISSEEIETYFFKLLSAFSNQIQSPKYLSLVALTQLAHFLDKYIYDRLCALRTMGGYTGHDDTAHVARAFGHDEIIELSKDNGRTIVVLANIRRHLLLAKDAIARVQSSPDQDRSLPAKALGTSDKLNLSMTEAAMVLKRQVTLNESYVDYLLERAKSQISVIQGLAAREDAAISIALSQDMRDLAQDSARLALKAVKDSSAMKTIAVMTMLFLPGTFFAAVFSMPVLKWDGSDVIQKKFWVYWAFTVPMTLLVLIVWYLLTRTNDRSHDSRPSAA